MCFKKYFGVLLTNTGLPDRSFLVSMSISDLEFSGFPYVTQTWQICRGRIQGFGLIGPGQPEELNICAYYMKLGGLAFL